MQNRFTWKPLAQETWDDFAGLFGARGACGGCWCMAWRLPRAQWEKGKGEANRRAIKKLCDSGRMPGILGYVDGAVAGWCSIAPREEFPVLQNSRTLRPAGSQPVWSISCFFIHKQYRRQGLSVKLLQAASRFVRSRGGRIVEGYPVIPKMTDMPDVFAWTGLPATFARAGFSACPTASKSRQVMRLTVSG
jgi:GNAT superfamily N-acetyltransferase